MRPPVVTDTDIALLRTLAREHSLVAASRRVGISRDRANYRLGRLEQALGGPLVRGVRGGRGHGGTELTPLGLGVARRGFDAVELRDSTRLPPNTFSAVYRRGPPPEVVVGRRAHLQVAFHAENGAQVALELDPESILIAPTRFPSSARNVFRAEVVELRPAADPIGTMLLVRAGPLRLRVAITSDSVERLGLRPGAVVWLYIKATALRRSDRPRPGRLGAGATRGSPRS